MDRRTRRRRARGRAALRTPVGGRRAALRRRRCHARLGPGPRARGDGAQVQGAPDGAGLMELTLNGACINYERSGAGLPVIFLHAGIADSRMWGAQADEFAREFDVIRPDTRGFGRSEMPPGGWSAESDLLALIDALELKPAHLVGCSMGGGIAIDFALLHPERISKLVLVGAAVSGTQPDPEDAKLYATAAAARQANDYEALNDAMLELFLDGPHRRPGYVARPIRELV